MWSLTHLLTCLAAALVTFWAWETAVGPYWRFKADLDRWRPGAGLPTYLSLGAAVGVAAVTLDLDPKVHPVLVALWGAAFVAVLVGSNRICRFLLAKFLGDQLATGLRTGRYHPEWLGAEHRYQDSEQVNEALARGAFAAPMKNLVNLADLVTRKHPGLGDAVADRAACALACLLASRAFLALEEAKAERDNLGRLIQMGEPIPEALYPLRDEMVREVYFEALFRAVLEASEKGEVERAQALEASRLETGGEGWSAWEKAMRAKAVADAYEWVGGLPEVVLRQRAAAEEA